MDSNQKPNILLEKADRFAWEIYRITKNFPKEEIFGSCSQIRRAALSVPLNIVEGFARYSVGEHRRFLEIAYGSLKEAKYLLYFSQRERYISINDYEKISGLGEEVAKTLWTKIQTLKQRK